MVRHIVFISVKSPTDTSKELVVQTLKNKLDTLKKQISVIHHLETGVNISTSPNAFDISLIVDVDSSKALDIYRNHPAHQDLLAYIQQIKTNIAVVDYNY